MQSSIYVDKYLINKPVFDGRIDNIYVTNGTIIHYGNINYQNGSADLYIIDNTTIDPNYVWMAWVINPRYADNTYGNGTLPQYRNIVGHPCGHSFADIRRDDKQEIKLYNHLGLVFYATMDLIDVAGNCVSGFGIPVWGGGDSEVYYGNSDFVEYTTSTSYNVNHYFNTTPYNVLSDSPTLGDENYTLYPGYEDWEPRMIYEIKINRSLFGGDSINISATEFLHLHKIPNRIGPHNIHVNPIIQPYYALNIVIDGSGTVERCPYPPYIYGTVVTLTAISSPGWSFIYWGGNASGSNPVTTVTMTSNKTVIAHFMQNIYTLSKTVDPITGGSISMAPAPPYYYGDVVTLTASANPGYSFDHWSGDASGSSYVTTVTMTGDKSVVAHFTLDVYTLSISVDPVAGGSVYAVPSSPYYYGDVVTLTASANPGYSFDHWSGDASGSSYVTTVTMTGDKSVVAHFTQNVYTLSITADPVAGGSVYATPAPPYHYGDVVTLTASANLGYSFNSWSGNASGSNPVTSVTMTDDKSVVAHFTQDTYTLSVNIIPVEGGTVSVVPSPPYYYGDVVTLTASANPGYSFDHWSDDAEGSEFETTVIMTGNMSVFAHFTPEIYTLSISVNPAIGGIVDVVPSPPYYYGDVVTLTASANPGYLFDQWSGNASGSNPVTSVTMTCNKSVVAQFTPEVYTLSITVDPVAGGSVYAVPSSPYYYLDVVTLTASANPGFHFSHWSGDASGSAYETTVIMTGDKSVVAHFTQDVYTLSISVDPVAGGSVGVVPSPPYYYGDVVSLTASANPGFSFSHWSGDASGSSYVTTVTMTGDKSVVAHFTQSTYTLSITVDPVAGGSVGVVPSPPYYYGDVVSLTASANPGFSFSHWSGDASGSNPVTSVTMTGDKSVVAHFTQNVYTLSISVDPVAGGSVSVVPSPPYYYGDVVSLTASANPGYSFDHWSGDASGTDPETTVTMHANKSVTAHFTENQYTLTINIVGKGTIIRNPDQQTYDFGTIVELTAIPDSEWTFKNWGGDLTGEQNPETITMNGNKTVTAYFEFTSIDTVPPTIEIKTPTNAIYIFNKFIIPFQTPIIVQMITFEANASDQETGIDRVEFLVDGISKANDTSQPYSYDWRELRCGKHIIQMKAYDKAGNTATTEELLVFKWRLHPILIIPILLLGYLWARENP